MPQILSEISMITLKMKIYNKNYSLHLKSVKTKSFISAFHKNPPYRRGQVRGRSVKTEHLPESRKSVEKQEVDSR